MTGSVTEADGLRDVLRRVVETADPEKVILFGSAARGEATAESDLDLLVVKEPPVHRGRLAEAIYIALIGAGRAVDVVVVTPEDLSRFGDDPYRVVQAALREGRVVYERTQ